jgi:hypothetical protein
MNASDNPSHINRTDPPHAARAFIVALACRARYRGHRSTSKEAGYDVSGRQYAGDDGTRPWDAFVDLRYEQPREYPRVHRWSPWEPDTGRYRMLYNTEAPAEGNLFGIFSGRASRLLGVANSGINLFTYRAEEGGAPKAGIRISSFREHGARSFPRSRFHWGIFVGVKGDDLKPPAELQPINLQMNLHGGFNLNKIHRYQLEYPDRVGGYGGLYMERSALDRLLQRLRADTEGRNGAGYAGEFLLCQRH